MLAGLVAALIASLVLGRGEHPRKQAEVPTLPSTTLVASESSGADPDPFPAFSAPVVDTAGVLSAKTVQEVSAAITSYQRRSSNQIAVAIVHTTGRRSLEDYSISLARTWGVGEKDKDNGILLLIAYDDRKLRIEVGRGLEGLLTDSKAGHIIEDVIVPRMRDGDPSGAVSLGVEAIRSALGDTVGAA